MSNLSASLSMNSSLGPGKVRAMFQARRNGGASAQGSPVGWDKSYPLEPINRSAGSGKNGTPGSRRSGSGPRSGGKPAPARKNAGTRRSPPETTPTVSGRRQAGRPGAGSGGRAAGIRRSRSQNNLAPGSGDGGAHKRSRSLSTRQRKPSHRQNDVNKINDEMRRREGEMLNKARGNALQKPAALRTRDQNQKVSKKNAAPAKAPAAPPAKKTLPVKTGGKSAAPAAPARSRRNSFNPYKENKPPATPTPRPPPTDPSLAQCPICTRSFAKDRLEKHQIICQKSHDHDKKRKAFDPVKMRMQGTESEKYIKKVKTTQPEEMSPAKKTDWRKQHEEFVHNIREAKRVQAHLAAGGDIRDLPTPTPAANDDYVQCPHCQRRFNEAAADRHIPKCASISSNKAPPPAKHKPAAARGKNKAKRR